MARHLGNDGDRLLILERLATVCPDSRASWGRMSPHQMICHLSDAFRFALGEKSATPATGPLQRAVIKFVAIYVPLRWPKGFRAPPEIEQGAGGTSPVEFESDRAELDALVQRFSTSASNLGDRLHPVFGQMNEFEWLRWGYLHADHHLRQFGA